MVRFKPKKFLAVGVLCCGSIYLILGVRYQTLRIPDVVVHSAPYVGILSSTHDTVTESSVRKVAKYQATGNTSLYTSSYLMNNPAICSSQTNLTFIVAVHSATQNFNKRLGIRQTWANQAHYKTFTMKTVFFVGRPSDNSTQSLIDAESRQYNDVVQGHFLDTYRNITYKAVMAFQWIYEFCSHAQMILKVDDDMFVNMFKIVYSRLPMLRRHPRQMMCEVVKNGRIRRDAQEKWAILPQELPGRKVYPTYCRGYLVIITPDLIEPMLNKVSSTNFFWIDDVYLYGLVPEFLGIQWRNLVPAIPGSPKECFHKYQNDRTRPYDPPDGCLNIPGREPMVNVWITVLKNLPEYIQALLPSHTAQSWI